MRTRGFEPIKNGVTILNTFIEEDDYRDDFIDWATDNGYTVKGDCAYNEHGVKIGTLYGYCENQKQYETEDFWESLRVVRDSSYNDYYVVTGSLGLWDGRHGGICETFDSLYAALSKCATDAYDIVVKYEDNAIKFECHHHDGTNYFEVYNLKYDDYDKIGWWDDELDGDVFKFIKKKAMPMSWEMLGQ